MTEYQRHGSGARADEERETSSSSEETTGVVKTSFATSAKAEDALCTSCNHHCLQRSVAISGDSYRVNLLSKLNMHLDISSDRSAESDADIIAFVPMHTHCIGTLFRGAVRMSEDADRSKSKKVSTLLLRAAYEHAQVNFNSGNNRLHRAGAVV